MRKVIPFAFLFLVLIIVVPSMVLGQGIYKWTDKDGNIHFSNAPTASENQKPERILGEKPAMKTCIKPRPYKDPSGKTKKDYWENVEYRKCLQSGGLPEDWE